VLLVAALLKAGSTIWAIVDLRFPHPSTGDRLRLFSRELSLLPGLLVLLAAVFAAAWAGRVVALTPRLARRARVLFLLVLAVATFLAVAQLVGFAWELTPDHLPFESFPPRGPAMLEEAAGAALSIAAVSSAGRRARTL
jgi:hypothetical protein